MNELKNITGRNPFKVPENYFDEINRKIISATAGSEPGSGKKGFTVRLKSYLTIAAAITALVIISYPLLKVIDSNKNKAKPPEITLEDFSGSYLDDIDLVILEEHAGLSAGSEIMQVSDKSEIIDYLLLENIDINELFGYL